MTERNERPMHSKSAVRAAFVLCTFLASGCSSGGSSALPAPAFDSPVDDYAAMAGQRIKHVVIIVQENRSFDNIFAGFPGAESKKYGYLRQGGKRVKVPLHAITFGGPDLPHGWQGAIADWDHGKMDGFNWHESNPRYGYGLLERDLVKPYWQMAQQYVLADHMFPTMFGGSFTAHLDLIATTANLGQNLSEVDFPTGYPYGCNAPLGTRTSTIDSQRAFGTNAGPFPCFNQFNTLATTLDAARVTWKYYAPALNTLGGEIWSEFDAIKAVACPTWTAGHPCVHGKEWNEHIVSPETTVLQDAARGTLPNVSWVIPSEPNSDHPTSNSDTGPSWVASVVNAVGQGPDWKSSAIVILWDDWGGWYDDLPPPQKDFRGLGIRVPCIIVSPYVKPHVSHTVYEFGSVVKFVEQTFGLKHLDFNDRGWGYTDQRAQSIVDSFDFTQNPRAFQPIQTQHSPAFFLSQPPSGQPPDTE